jgi:hypothetical protein
LLESFKDRGAGHLPPIPSVSPRIQSLEVVASILQAQFLTGCGLVGLPLEGGDQLLSILKNMVKIPRHLFTPLPRGGLNGDLRECALRVDEEWQGKGGNEENGFHEMLLTFRKCS